MILQLKIKKINNIISSPFSTNSISTKNNFNKEKIREKLKEIILIRDII